MAKNESIGHLKCGNCGEWFRHPLDSFPSECPKCGKQITAMTCNRCGHSWNLKKMAYPKICPKCKNPYWATEKYKFLEERGEFKI